MKKAMFRPNIALIWPDIYIYIWPYIHMEAAPFPWAPPRLPKVGGLLRGGCGAESHARLRPGFQTDTVLEPSSRLSGLL